MSADRYDVVRDHGGVTYAPGCVTEFGRMSWPMMQARMTGAPARAPVSLRAAVLTAQPAHTEPVLPDELVGTTRGRLYAALLACADRGDVLPTNKILAVTIGVPTACNPETEISESLRGLLLGNFLRIVREPGNQRRTITILATGQVLTNAQAHARAAA